MENYIIKKAIKTLFNGHYIGLGIDSVDLDSATSDIDGYSIKIHGMSDIYLYLSILSLHSKTKKYNKFFIPNIDRDGGKYYHKGIGYNGTQIGCNCIGKEFHCIGIGYGYKQTFGA